MGPIRCARNCCCSCQIYVNSEALKKYAGIWFNTKRRLFCPKARQTSAFSDLSHNGPCRQLYRGEPVKSGYRQTIGQGRRQTGYGGCAQAVELSCADRGKRRRRQSLQIGCRHRVQLCPLQQTCLSRTQLTNCRSRQGTESSAVKTTNLRRRQTGHLGRRQRHPKVRRRQAVECRRAQATDTGRREVTLNGFHRDGTQRAQLGGRQQTLRRRRNRRQRRR